ncbi:MAG: tRNA preQ1(34) S-adenosylmethionine ribosyltransferase-isomerase QueA [Armatimonadota bacterium]
MRLANFDYTLPAELIAQRPVSPRDSSRLLVLDRATGHIAHRLFHQIGEYLKPGDVLVVNDTRVIPARLRGRRPTGGAIELLLLRPRANGAWEALVRPGRRLDRGALVDIGDGTATVEIGERLPDGRRTVRLRGGGEMLDVLHRLGGAPLPPYIRTSGDDPAIKAAYQTVYAREDGAVAAPTAGLHFTPELLDRIRAQGIEVVSLTLHVGLGTFQPVTAADVRDHTMDEEYYTITPAAAEAINTRRGRLVAVGTTTVRALETAVSSAGPDARAGCVRAGSAMTRLFILPGFAFRAVEVLLTNFHLPRTTLLMLVSAFAGRETILSAYDEAIGERYRFYSFGDAMLIV